jgi:hypothetical protein
MTTLTPPVKPIIWDSKYIIENLPNWIYTDSPQPKDIADCKARISSIEYTLMDIDLQIEIRELELKTGSSRHTSNFAYEKWKAQALRAKQTHLYMLNAYKYWLILNKRDISPVNLNEKLNKVITLLIEDPDTFVFDLEKLL